METTLDKILKCEEKALSKHPERIEEFFCELKGVGDTLRFWAALSLLILEEHEGGNPRRPFPPWKESLDWAEQRLQFWRKLFYGDK